jgi:probable rRNA maturation factor
MSQVEGHPAVVIHRGSELDPESFGDRLETALSASLKVVLDEVGLGMHASRCELSVTITDDEGIRRINREHRGTDEPTDTLSFPVSDTSELATEPNGDAPPIVLGDIVMSVETIARQAEERGLRLVERFAECLAHGILHLLGWGHETEGERKRMEELEDRLVPMVERSLGGWAPGDFGPGGGDKRR